MTTEEKAKAYDIALDKIKRLLGTGSNCSREDLEYVFPELAESEDERMWKLIKKYAHCNISDMALNADHITREQLESWLEKQGEQKPHFELKAGHWYICHRAFCCRADHLTVKEGERFMCEKDGVVKGFVTKEPEKYFKEVCAPAPMEDEQKPAEDRYMEGYLNGINDTLKTQKPAEWSEEDEKKLLCICAWIKDYPRIANFKDEMYTVANNYINWLKSIKGRVLPQPKQEWSEEDKEIIDYLIDYLESELDSSYTDLDKETFTKEINWLKSLRPQSQWKPSDEQMEYLAKAIATLGEEGDCKTASILNDLRAELKKLMEE